LKWSFYDATCDGGRSSGWLSLLDLGEIEREIDPNYVWGLNFAIRRRALHDLGGFHPVVRGNDASVDSVNVKSLQLPYVRGIAGRVVRYLKHLRDHACETAEVAVIRERVHRAYHAGYEFHQSAVRSSPELLAWVLRPAYWDYSLPQRKRKPSAARNCQLVDSGHRGDRR
jgi:hypothetical protein